MSRTLAAMATALLLSSLPIYAHHAFAAEYDANKTITVTGVVTRLDWTNPHAWLYVEGKDETGVAAVWGFEMGSPNGLVNRGWTKTALKPGDHVTVDGYRAKDGRKIANARIVTLPDGQKLFGGFQSTPGSHRP
jgi:Family of unknown function (DUF6152)